MKTVTLHTSPAANADARSNLVDDDDQDECTVCRNARSSLVAEWHRGSTPRLRRDSAAYYARLAQVAGRAFAADSSSPRCVALMESVASAMSPALALG